MIKRRFSPIHLTTYIFVVFHPLAPHPSSHLLGQRLSTSRPMRLRSPGGSRFGRTTKRCEAGCSRPVADRGRESFTKKIPSEMRRFPLRLTRLIKVHRGWNSMKRNSFCIFLDCTFIKSLSVERRCRDRYCSCNNVVYHFLIYIFVCLLSF